MRKETVVSAKTIEEAVAKAVAELGAGSAEEIEYTVLEEPKKGLFGIGAIPAKISASYTLGGEYLALDFLTKLVANMQLDLKVSLSDGNNDDKVINIDGEAVFSKDVSIRLVPGAGRLIVPKGLHFFDSQSSGAL